MFTYNVHNNTINVSDIYFDVSIKLFICLQHFYM